MSGPRRVEPALPRGPLPAPNEHRDSGAAFALWVALGVGALAIAVRLPGALEYAFWQDEVSSAAVLTASSPRDALAQVAGRESTPPAWYAVGWLLHAGGVPVELVRLVSVVAGGAAAGLTVLLAARTLPLAASAFAGTLVALGWQLYRHGYELRAYGLLLLAAAAFAYVLLRAAEDPSLVRLALLSGAVAVGSLTHYLFFATLAPAVVWVWATGGFARRRLLAACAAGLVPFILWSPWLVTQFRSQRFSWIGSFDVERIVDTYLAMLVPPVGLGSLRVWTAGLLTLATVAFGASLLARLGRSGLLYALLAVAPVGLAALVWLVGPSVYHSRNLAAVAPFAAIALAAAAARLGRVLGVAVASLGILAVATLGLQEDPPVAYDAIAADLTALGWNADDPIVVFGRPYAAALPLRWYLPGEPDLRPARVAGTGCPVAFVVVPDGHWPRVSTRLMPREAVRRSRHVLGRIEGTVLEQAGRAGGTPFGAAGTPPPCLAVAGRDERVPPER